MIRIIKMDLYRIFRSKSAWILLLLGAAFTILSVCMIKQDVDAMRTDANYYNECVQMSNDANAKYSEQPDGEYFISGNIGVIINTDVKWAENNYKISLMELLMVNISSKVYLIFIGIASAIFVRAEQKNGYIKTIAGLLPSRTGFAFSKFFTAGIYAITSFAVIIISTAVGSMLVFGYIKLGDFSVLPIKILTELFLHISFSSLITFLCIAFNNSASGIFTSTAIGTGLFEIIYSLINCFLIKILGVNKGFIIFRYLVSGNISMLNKFGDGADIIRACTVALIFAVCFTAAGAYLMKKRDVE